VLRRAARRGVRGRATAPRQGLRPHEGEQALHRASLRHLSAAPAFRYRPRSDGDPARTLYVDGTATGFRTLSHWPGNSTPAELKHDLSTGIALNAARLSPERRRELLGDFDEVANNHYDTDGALSAFALLRPELALPRADFMLEAAAAGDFSAWRGEAALAVDLTVTDLARGPRSPLAGSLPPGADDEQRHAASYAWLLEHLAEVLDDPYAMRSLWDERHGQIVDDVRRIEAGTGISARLFPEFDLALVSSDRPLTSVGLNVAAGEASRVLYVLPSREGYRYRFRYRVESWFELVSRRVPPRPPLAPVLELLDRAEGLGARRGDGPAWWCDAPESPVCELGFGRSGARTSPFEDPAVERDPPSRLLPSTVIDCLASAWKPAGPPGGRPAAGRARR